MKTKLCVFFCVVAAAVLTVSLGNSALGQMGMGGPAKNTTAPPSSGIQDTSRGTSQGTSQPAPGSGKAKPAMFAPNPKLPPDAVELSSSEHPNKSDYFPTRPKTRPANVPPDYIAVRVFQGKTLVGWTYLSKEAVAMLHKSKKT